MDDQDTVKGKVKINPADEVEVPIRLRMAGFLPSVVAQHLTVQKTAGSILVSFYEINPPLMLNPTPDSIETLKKEGMFAECVARVSIPEGQFSSFAEVFSQIAEQLKRKEEEGQDADPGKDKK